jgi:hypothetical protein
MLIKLSAYSCPDKNVGRNDNIETDKSNLVSAKKESFGKPNDSKFYSCGYYP